MLTKHLLKWNMIFNLFFSLISSLFFAPSNSYTGGMFSWRPLILDEWAFVW